MQPTMANLQNDITEIKSTVNSVVDNQKVLFDSQRRVERGLFGSVEFQEEGLVGQVARHEKTVQTVNTILSNARFFWAMMGVLGVSSIASLIDLVQKVFAR